MTRRDTPQSERRAALDAAIAALDEQRRDLSDAIVRHGNSRHNGVRRAEIDSINRYIAILTAMREEGPLL